MKPWTDAIYRNFIKEQHDNLPVMEREMGPGFDISSAVYDMASGFIWGDKRRMGPIPEKILERGGLITYLQNLGVKPGLEAERLSNDIYSGDAGV